MYTTTKYHFYKLGKEPDLPHRYYNHSTGLTGFLAPQALDNYLGYLTINEAEKLVEKKHVNHLNRRKSIYRR